LYLVGTSYIVMGDVKVNRSYHVGSQSHEITIVTWKKCTPFIFINI
jgi:hypothetical protein